MNVGRVGKRWMKPGEERAGGPWRGAVGPPEAEGAAPPTPSGNFNGRAEEHRGDLCSVGTRQPTRAKVQDRFSQGGCVIAE